MADPNDNNARPVAAPAQPTPLASSTSGVPSKRRRGGWRLFGLAAAALLALLLVLGGVAGGALWWIAGSEEGTTWLIEQAGVDMRVTAPRGSLLGDFEAARVEIRLPAPAAAGSPALADGKLVLTNAGWRGLQLRIGPRAGGGGWLRIRLADLHAARIDLALPGDDPARPKTPPQLPRSLRLPLEFELGSLRIGELHAAALGEQPLREVTARNLHVGADGGLQHRIEALSLGWDRLRASGAARIDADAPFALDVQVDLAQGAGAVSNLSAQADRAAVPSAQPGSAATPAAAGADLAWRAALKASGPLSQPTVTATVRVAATADRPLPAAAAPPSSAATANPPPARGPNAPAGRTAASGAGAAEQTLDARAVLRPFAAWPLADLAASTRDLDLSALQAAWPTTALTGSADVRTLGLDQPATLAIELANGHAGRWNEGLLPLRRLKVELRGRPDERRSLDLQAFDAELGSAAEPAGHLEGSGRWTPERSTLDTRVTALQPALLDARAAPMRLSGSVAVAASGIDPAAPERAVIDLRADLSGPLAGWFDTLAQRSDQAGAKTAVKPAAKATAVRPGAGAARASAGGSRASASPRRNASAAGPATQQQARLRLDATASLLKVDLREAVASVGGARASLSGSADRSSTAAPWHARAKAALVDFDPQPWWPGADDSAWRRGPHRVNATAEVDLTLAALGQPPRSAALAASSSSSSSASAAGGRAASTAGSTVATTARAKVATPQAEASTIDGLLAALTGSATLNIERGSLLAGVPVAAQASLKHPAGEPAQATLTADLAGNRLAASGRLAVSNAAGAGSADQAEATVAAADLARLAPLWRLAMAGGGDSALAGALNGGATLRGRWPELTSSGRLDGNGLVATLPAASGASAGAANRVSVQTLSARWQLGTAADAPVDLQATLNGLKLPGSAGGGGAGGAAAGTAGSGAGASVGGTPTIDSAQLRLQGTAAAHTLSLNVESNALPPAWADALQSPPTPIAAAAAAVGTPAAPTPVSPTAVAAAASPAAPARSVARLQLQGGLFGAGGWADPARPSGIAQPAGSSSASGSDSVRSSGSSGSAESAPSRRSEAAPSATSAATRGAARGPIRVPADGNQRPAGAAPAAGGALAAAGWRGTLQRAELRSSRVGAPPWLLASDVGVSAQWAGGPARVAVQPGRLDVLGAALRFGRIDWQAAVPGGEPARLNAQATLEPLPVAPLLARVQPDFGWGGDLRIGGRLDVKTSTTTVAGAAAFSADVVVERAGGDLTVTDEFGTQPLGLSDLRIGLNAQNGVWSFTQALAGKSLGVLAGAVVARTTPAATWPAADTPIEGVLELQVANLATWGTWVPTGWRLGGELRTSASIGGRFGAPEYTGKVTGNGLWVRNFLQGVNVNDGELAITLAGSTARIERFTAKAGSGSVTLEGDASLGAAPRAALRLRADRFQLLGRVDRRVVASGQAQLALDRDAIALDGKLTVDEGLIDFSRGDAPSLSDDVVVLRRPAAASAAQAQAVVAGAPTLPNGAPPAATSGRPAAQATPTAAVAGPNRAPSSAPTSAPAPATGSPAGSSRSLALNLQVDLGTQLKLRGRGIDSGLRGELRITSPNNRLAINGTVSTFGGTYAAYGQKLAIDRGAITFAGGVDNPRLDIEATRPDIDTRVGVRVSGTALNPRVRLFSEPDLPDIDKLSWLVLGRASDGAGGADTALLQRAAMALFAGEGESTTGQWTKAIGLDDIGLKQTDGEVRNTVITLGKQVSQRLYVGYERGLNATTGSWQLIYRVARRFTLRAQTGDDNSLDVIWSWRWQ